MRIMEYGLRLVEDWTTNILGWGAHGSGASTILLGLRTLRQTSAGGA